MQCAPNGGLHRWHYSSKSYYWSEQEQEQKSGFWIKANEKLPAVGAVDKHKCDMRDLTVQKYVSGRRRSQDSVQIKRRQNDGSQQIYRQIIYFSVLLLISQAYKLRFVYTVSQTIWRHSRPNSKSDHSPLQCNDSTKSIWYRAMRISLAKELTRKIAGNQDSCNIRNVQLQ